MAADELTRSLLLEEVAARRSIGDALFASVNGGVPLLQALVDSGAASPEVLARYLARTETPFLRQVVPLPELVDRLPAGLCARLLAVPVRVDAITGTIDVVVADPADPHPASEIGFHLEAPVRMIRAPVGAIEESLRRLRMRRDDGPIERFREAASHASREIAQQAEDPWSSRTAEHHADAPNTIRDPVQPREEPAPPSLAPARVGWDDDPAPTRRKAGLVVEPESAPPPALPAKRLKTPAWGTPIHAAVRAPTEPPKSGYGSEIPIPLMKKTVGPIRGGTQRPPPFLDPSRSGLGEGYAFDQTDLRDVIERTAPSRSGNRSAPLDLRESSPPRGLGPRMPNPVSLPPAPPLGSFIPGPPPLPGASSFGASDSPQGLPQLPFPEMGGIMAALRNAGSRDDVLELVLTGARVVALKVALFVVKRGGYLGWVGTPEFGDRAQLQSILVPLEASSIFDRAVREDLYLGPIRYDDVHAPLLRVLKNPTRDVAVVPIRVSGKTAVIILADELGDTMIGTRRLEELARAAGESFARIVRTRR